MQFYDAGLVLHRLLVAVWWGIWSVFLLFPVCWRIHDVEHIEHTHSYTVSRDSHARHYLLIRSNKHSYTLNWGSASHVKTLWHVICRGKEFNHRPSYWWMTTLPPEQKPANKTEVTNVGCVSSCPTEAWAISFCYMQPNGNNVQHRLDRHVVCWLWWWGLWGCSLPWAEQTLSPHGDDENSPHKVEVERPELYIDKVMSAHEDEINRPGYSDFNSLWAAWCV